MGLAGRRRSGRVLGRLAAVGSLASMGGMVVVVFLSEALGHRPFYVFGGALAIVAAFVVYRLPRDIGSDLDRVPRIVLRRRYWLFYVLTFFEGSRTQVFHTFGAWVLVNAYGLSARQISLLLITSGALNFFLSPRVGNWIDRYGERWLLASSYFGLVLAFIGYASVQSPWALGALYIAINLLVMFRIGLHTYVNRIARDGDLSPTLSAGVSINHVTSVGMSLVAGTLLRTIGYEGLCWGAAGIILLSIPFALAIRVDPGVESGDS
jgi:predicted MFS family arabinose efflux permease